MFGLGLPEVLVILLVVAAVITPTQDVFNMLIFALPMFLLYEIGILIAGAIERRKERYQN